MSEYSLGVCSDGAAILKNGKMMTIEEVIIELERGDKMALKSYAQDMEIDRLQTSNALNLDSIKKLQKENGELKAHIELINDAYERTQDERCAQVIDNILFAALKMTPKQSLAKIKADAIREAAPEIIKDFGLKARNHLRSVIRDHKYCDHPQVVGNFIDIYRKSYMELFLGEYADKLEQDNE